MQRLLQYGSIASVVLLDNARGQRTNFFWPNGMPSTPTDTYLPCDEDSNDTYSTCCAEMDMCTTNGLCKPVGDADNNKFWRNGCTDPTWRSPNCVNHCLINPDTGALNNNSWQVWACTQTTYCCAVSPWFADQRSNYTCCDTPGAVFDIGPAVSLSGKKFATTQFPVTMATASVSSASSSSSSSSAVSAITGTASFATPSPTTTAAVSQGLSTGAMAGIGVGAAAMAIILAVVAWFILKSRRQRKVAPHEISRLAGVGRQMEIDSAAEKPDEYNTSVPVSEAHSRWRGHELGDHNNKPLRDHPAEMAAGRFERQELP